jgi:hypothetical protein
MNNALQLKKGIMEITVEETGDFVAGNLAPIRAQLLSLNVRLSPRFLLALLAAAFPITGLAVAVTDVGKVLVARVLLFLRF